MQKNELPIHKYEKQIIQAIESEPVVIISGKTGCGKSTQVPQFILKSNRHAIIAVCEPRRLAATSLAMRVSQQLNCKLGTLVGYHIGMEVYKNEKTQLIYMTYGILIHQLMFKEDIPYSYIILDQVHQRSLQMDFTFIALKTIINSKYKGKIKLIVMSATLNSQLFSHYFCTHNDTTQFFTPNITVEENIETIQNSRRNRDIKTQFEFTRKVIKYNVSKPNKDYRLGFSFNLIDERMYKVQQLFLQDISKRSLIYQYGDQTRASDEMYQTAIYLISTFEKKLEGDILVFIPGLFQIKLLKNKLMKDLQMDEKRIIQVHSIFSEDLYWRLFDKNIKNKIILATNMGQSSITLPSCKIVIDFCLTRKNFANKIKGISKFQTRLASKANLTQRSGRVGRVSDGKVYRLITKNQYESLPEFDIPEIKCVSLEMVILKAKQLDKINGSNLFKNPYAMLLSAIQPPQAFEIDAAMACLMREEALVNENKEDEEISYINGENVKLTNVGQFMVSMPCDLRISKMILVGLKLKIPQVIIGIASILMCQKPFFAHQQKRHNIQQYLHALVGYDHGFYNDFLLRQHLFYHWKQIFYLPVKSKNIYKRKHQWIQINQQEQQNSFNRHYNMEDQQEQMYRILEQFNQQKWSQNQQQWCLIKGVYPNCMRQILKIYENIRMKIECLNYKFVQQQNVVNELVLLCLTYAFPNNQCQIKWELSQKYLKPILSDQQFPMYIDILNCEESSDYNISSYCHPETKFKITLSENLKKKRIFCTPSILSKFLLPIHFSKANIQKTSPLYKWLTNSKPFYYYTSTVSLRKWPILILNESINKVNIKIRPNTNYYLITNNVLQSKQKKMITACALIEEGTLHIIQLVTKNNVYVCPHPSNQFFSTFKIQDKCCQFSTLIRNQDLKVIIQMRHILKRQKENKIICTEQEISQNDRSKLIFLLKNLPKKPEKEQWQHLFMKDEYKQKIEQKYYLLENAPILNTTAQYYAKYVKWKKQKAKQFLHSYRPLLLQKATLICKQCQKQQIVEIETLSSYDIKSKRLSLNPYSGSWKIAEDKKTLTCRFKHKVGNVLDDDFAEVIHQTLYLYIPYKKIKHFTSQFSQQHFEEVLAQQAYGLQELYQIKNEIYTFSCIFCYTINQYNESILKQFNRATLKNQFWKKIFEHMGSKDHINNRDKFMYVNKIK